MNGFEWNKVFGAVILAALIASLAGFAARETMMVEPSEKIAFPVDQLKLTDETAPGGAVVEEPKIDPIEDLLASANVEEGQKLSRLCAACHNFEKDGPNKVGPNLWGIVGAPHAHREDFTCSEALKAMRDKKWTYADLNEFLFSPKRYVPGTKMAFIGIKSTQDRANLIAWLRTLSDNPEPLPPGKP